MRKLIAIALLAALLASAATGDTVHMRDGRALVGKVTKVGDKLKIKTPLGVIVVDQTDVIYVAYGDGEAKPATTGPATHRPPKPVTVKPDVVWNISKAVLPDQIVFMLSRRLEALPGASSTSLREQIRIRKIAAHEAQRKVAATWLTRDEQRRRRAIYEENLRNARDLLRQAESLERSSKRDAKAKAKELRAKARGQLDAGVRVWPDMTMRMFLSGLVDLESKDYKSADKHFRTCIEAEPLVAGFRQARGLALVGLKRPLAALAEFTASLELRDDDFESIRMVEETMKTVPGAKLQDPIHVRAKALLDRYEKPDRAIRRRRSRGAVWMMPGKKPWTVTDRSPLPLPPYDRIVTRQALGVAIAENALLVDAAAVKGAAAMYVQLEPGLIVQARPKRKSYAALAGGGEEVDIPLTAIIVPTATFTPVDVANPVPLKDDQYVTVRAVNAYRRMGTAIRTGTARVSKPEKGQATLAGGCQPGERAGAVFVDKTFAAMFTARTDVQGPGCGTSQLVKPADLAQGVKNMARSLRYKRPGGFMLTPRLKEDAPKHKAVGSTFLVFIVVGETAPPPLLK